MNRDQNLLAGAGKVDQLTQSGLGFTKGSNHVTTLVLFWISSREMLFGLAADSAAPDKAPPRLERPPLCLEGATTSLERPFSPLKKAANGLERPLPPLERATLGLGGATKPLERATSALGTPEKLVAGAE
jgi:hypothetical protein